MKNFESFRFTFYAVSVCIFFSLMYVATQVGATGDEPIDGGNGRYSLEYYTHGDTTFADYSKVPYVINKHMKYYGVGFEILPAIILKYTGWNAYEYQIRHILCAIFGFLFMFFAALIAKELKNWTLATVTLLIMGISPIVFGLSPLDSKDVPMAAGFAIAILGFLKIYKNLPAYKWGDILMVVAGIALAVSVRIGGLLLAFYFGVGGLMVLFMRKDLRLLFTQKQYGKLTRIILIALSIVTAGILLGLCAYPNFFHEGPVGHIKNAFLLVKKFQQRIPLLFEGQNVTSLNLPPLYLWKSYLYTIPLFAWLGLICFGLQFKNVWKNYDRPAILFILFTLLFPPFYIAFGDSNIYNGWRHTLFIFSSFAVIAAIGFYETYNWLGKRLLQQAFIGVITACMLTTAYWMMRNYKYCYSYYNALVAEPYLNHDMDYYETSCFNAYEWLAKQVLLKSDTVVRVGTKNNMVEYYQKIRKYPNVQMGLCSFRGFAETDFDYLILTIQFIPPHVLKSFFPPKGTVHTECVDGKPVCAVVKRENKYDSQGIKAMRERKIDEGVALLEKAYQYNPDNFGIWFWLGYGYYYQHKYKECITIFQKYLNFWPSSGQAVMAMTFTGHALVELQLYDQAINVLKQAENMSGAQANQSFIQAQLGIAYFNKQAYKEAMVYLKKVVRVYPLLNDMLNRCYAELGGNHK